MDSLTNRIFRRGLCVSLFCVTALQLLAGGWPREKGMAYLKLYEWWVVADQHYTDAGELDPNTTNGIFNTILYGEYGFTNKLTGVISAPVFSRAYFNNTRSETTGELITPGEAINTIGDIDVAVRYGLFARNGWAWSATLTLGLPTGQDSGGTDGNLQTGDGEFNQMLQTDLGKGFTIAGLPAWTNVYLGVNNRTDGFSDEMRYGVEFGVNLFDQTIFLVARLYGVESMRNGETAATINSTSIFANNTEYLSFSPEIGWNISDRFGVALSYGTLLRGRIIFADPSYSAGVFMRFGR